MPMQRMKFAAEIYFEMGKANIGINRLDSRRVTTEIRPNTRKTWRTEGCSEEKHQTASRKP